MKPAKPKTATPSGSRGTRRTATQAAPLRGAGVTSVAAEIHQTRPFRSPAQEAMIAVVLTADRVLGKVAEELARVSDLTYQQYNVLRILRGAGAGGLPTLAIADRMIERAPGVTRLLDRLEKKGLIARVREGEDRRQVLCRATRSGLQLLERLDPIVDALDDLPLRRLGHGELRELVASLDRLRAALA